MRVLITAGQVYGRLDDNKLVGNRVRGIWAIRFAEYLMQRGHEVTLLIADTQTKLWGTVVGEHANMEIVRHTGFDDYHDKCIRLAPLHDAAVMAAAVVNWIPKEPFAGKMPTEGYEVGDEINIRFYLAPRVINDMRLMNPKLTLIGCKMLINAQDWELQGAAHKLAMASKAHVVIANDMGRGLRRKLLVYPDRTVVEYNDDFDRFFNDLRLLIEDKHWRTKDLVEWDLTQATLQADAWSETRDLFNAVVERYKQRFYIRSGHTVFGSLLVRGPGGFALSPRTKGPGFSYDDAVLVQNIAPEDRAVLVAKQDDIENPVEKATMNAPLLIRMWQQYRPCAVLHLHEQLPGVPTVPYAPPGTDRDNLRDLPGTVFNIEGHGFIACLDDDLEIPA